jgi:hypothetical protein
MTSKTGPQINKKSERGLLDGLSSVSSLLSPKNITIEIKEDLVKELLQRLGNNGVILSLRNQNEIAEDEEGKVTEESGQNSKELDSVLHAMAKMNQKDSAEILKKSRNKDKDFSILLDNINSAGTKNSKEILIKKQKDKRAAEQTEAMLIESINFSDKNVSKNALLESKKQKELSEANMSLILKSMNSIDGNNNGNNIGKQINFSNKKLVKNAKTGRYEIVSGKIVGEEPEEENSSVVIYRKLKADAVQFDGSGKKIDANSGNPESSESSGNSKFLRKSSTASE